MHRRVSKLRSWFPGIFGVLAIVAGCSDRGSDDTASAPVVAPDGARAAMIARLLNASPQQIAAEPELLRLVEDLAQPAIAQHCASCHGADLRGKHGVPNLVDAEWIWGSSMDDSEVGTVMSIERTLRHGIRNKDCPPERQQYGACDDTRFSQMPGYAANGTLTADRIADLTEFLLQLGGQEADATAAARAETDFQQLCSECHGEFGEGSKEFGGPDLSDEVSLYGGDRDSLRASITAGREGVCPPFGDVLDAATIKALAIYLRHKAE